MPVRNMMQKVLNVMVDRRHAVEPLPLKRDQDPRHDTTIITPQLLTPERCLVQPGQMDPQNQVTGNRVNQDLPTKQYRSEYAVGVSL
jgi:hypothetical protein